MAKKTATTQSKRRAKVKALPTRKKLTAEQAKGVKGGISGGIQVAMGDGSVRNITDGTSNTIIAVKK